MSLTRSAGKAFREAVSQSKPLQCLGTVNAYSALTAEKCGASAIYLSGSGVATASFGIPDLGVTNLADVCEDIRRITSVSKLPLLVDVDTGFGSALGIRRCVQETCKAGAGAIHIEDQVAEKRCGHRPGKQIVTLEEMKDRISVAHVTRQEVDPDFVIMARTDSFANEGIDGCIARCEAYINAGADMLFPEAINKLEDYALIHQALPDVPILANITEFGQTPLYSREELHAHGVSIVLYPLSAHRAMMKAAETVYTSILKDGHQQNVVDIMQTRKELYNYLDYYKYENLMDDLFGKDK